MPMTAVSRCSQCEAIVNVHWQACLVCRAMLPPVLEATAPTPLTPDNQGRKEGPQAPILPGWLVTYRDKTGNLSGGAEDRGHGTVQACRWEGALWSVYLTDGQRVPLSHVVGVAKTDATGRILVVWTVRRHGYDGEKTF
jgi:hypothetical protein